jgi:hypothetical protein
LLLRCSGIEVHLGRYSSTSSQDCLIDSASLRELGELVLVIVLG